MTISLGAEPKANPRQRAYPMALLGGPKSPQAAALVQSILTDIVIPANTKVTDDGELDDPRDTSASKLTVAAGALLSDLFDHHQAGRDGSPILGARGLSRSNFPAKHLGFGYDIFRQVVDPMVAASLLAQTKGLPKWQKVFEKVVNVGGKATTYGLTPALLDLAASCGVEPGAWRDHWYRTDCRPLQVPSDTPRLILRSKRERVKGKKKEAIDLPFDLEAHAVRAILSQLNALNAYLSRQTIGGVAFPGLRRIFNDGDQPDFAWNKGGRFYSLPGGHYYEVWNADRRREAISINGEAVNEVDLRASHLTLLHALLGRRFDAHKDAYKIGDWPRAVVKAWVSQAIGASNPRPFQWSQDAEDAYEDERPGQFINDAFAIREVGADVTERHPLLLDLKFCEIGTLDLQYHEAEILRLAMEDLMLGQDIPVLPMHDALIAPRSKASEAKEALKRAFGAHVESVTGQPSVVKPKVTIKDPIRQRVPVIA